MSYPVFAQADDEDPFAAIDQMLDANFDTVDRSLEEQFEMIDQAMEQAYQRFGEEIEGRWGEKEVKLPDNNTWVDYSENLDLRRVLDFETGFIEIEQVVPRETPPDPARLAQALAEVINEAQQHTPSDLREKDTALVYATESLAQDGVAIPEPATDSPSDTQPILEEVLDISEDLREDIEDKLASTTLHGASANTSATAEVTAPVSDDALEPSSKASSEPSSAPVVNVRPLSTTEQVISVRVPFKAGYQSTLADRYIEAIRHEAARQQLPPSLLLAVMETESSFNPRATSPIPAYGLMQLVPRSGAMDAYQYVYGEKTLLGPDYLYQPGKNVELGSAYLSLLFNRYLRHVENEDTRMICVIAAYNTGAGNVARAFIGNNNVRDAARIINGMSPEEVYDYLRDNLPYEETRRYIQKVTVAQEKYRRYDNVGLGVARLTHTRSMDMQP
ncbi:MAG: murein transglycosylase domain-containing protein [Pseudomonadota bacterium]